MSRKKYDVVTLERFVDRYLDAASDAFVFQQSAVQVYPLSLAVARIKPPTTPLNLAASRASYLATGRGVFDFDQLNTQRLGTFQQFDFRLDKRVNWRRFTLDLFFDVQNAFVLRNPTIPSYAFQRLPDNSDFATTDGQPIRPDGSNGIPLLLTNDDPITTPTIGFILEF